MDQSLTFAYVLPDDAEHACEAFSVPATRKSGAACAVKWDGPESGHELAVTEQTMRAYAAKPRVAFTITREAPFVVPGDRSGDADRDAGTDGETNGPADDDENAAPERGAPIVSAVEVELASLMLGSRRAVTATFGAASDADADGGARAIFGAPAAPMPEALRGFASATITVSLDPFDDDDDGKGKTERVATEMEKQPFLPPGLASAMEPFAVTVSTARSLPDAPATRDALRACAPVACRVRWAGMPVATVEAARGETDWVAADATVGGADVGAKAVTKKVPEKKPRAYATRRFGADVGDEPSRTHTRDVTFGRSVLWFGCDVPSETYPEGMVSACGEAVQVRVYDRSAPPDPDPFPVASATEADGEKASDVTVTGEDEDGTKNENANENDDTGMDEETEAAREAERRASLCLEFPDAESAAYGFASFDVRHMARRSNAPIVTPRAFASMEAPLVPCAMSRSGAASWRTRPGRFLEAGSTVTLTVEMAVPPRARALPEAAAAAAGNAEATDGASRDEGDETETRVETEFEREENVISVAATETTSRGPFVRATCTFPCDGGGASFLRAVIAATRAQNAKALRADAAVADAAVAEDDARLRFRLANAEVSEARASDPDDPCFHLVTGYHLVDGAARQITVEGTPEAVAPIAALFAARRAEANAATRDAETETKRGDGDGSWSFVMDASARFATRAYHLPEKRKTENNQKVFAGDVFFAPNSVRLRDTLATIVAEPETHVGDRVKPEAREGLRRARALAEKNTRARRASESNLYPDPDMLRALDRAFGVALVQEDFCAEASEATRRLSRSHEDDAERKTNAKSDAKSDASSATRGVSSKASRAFFESTRASEKRVKKHPPLTIENSAYLAGLARARVARAERDVQKEVHQATIGRLERTRGAARRDAWAEWNVRRAPRDAFESETETARRHATASTKPVPPPTPGWGRTHAAPFTWPAAHDAAASRVPVAKRPPQSRVDELAEPWSEPTSEHFPTTYFASSFFPGGALDLTKSRASERRGGEALSFPKPFETRKLRNEARLGAFDGDVDRERALWENSEDARRTSASRRENGKTAAKVTPWRDATAPRLKAPAQTDKTRGVLRDPPVKKSLTGKYVKGAAAPAPHSMFLEEPPADLNGLSLDETFSRSLRRGALDAAAFLEGSTRLDPSTFVAGKDFVRHNVGSRSMSHTGRAAGVGEVAPPRTRAQRRAS